jgi:hypothetical protein
MKKITGSMRGAVVATAIWILANAINSYAGMSILLKGGPTPPAPMNEQQRLVEHNLQIERCEAERRAKYDSPLQRSLRQLSSADRANDASDIFDNCNAPYTSAEEAEYQRDYFAWSNIQKQGLDSVWSFIRVSLVGSVIILLAPFAIAWIRKGFGAEPT